MLTENNNNSNVVNRCDGQKPTASPGLTFEELIEWGQAALERLELNYRSFVTGNTTFRHRSP